MIGRQQRKAHEVLIWGGARPSDAASLSTAESNRPRSHARATESPSHHLSIRRDADRAGDAMTEAPMDLRWEFHGAGDWAKAASLWDRVNAEAGGLPFFESAFVGPLLAHFGDGGEFIALGHRAGRCVAAAILRRAGAGRAATFQPSQLPLGPWLVARGEDPTEMARSLMTKMPGLVLGLGLTQVDPLLQARPLDGPSLDTLDFIATGWVDVAGTFDAYWEARGKNLRTNMRKQRTKLDAEGVQVVFDTLRGDADVASAITDYGRLEAAGWKAGTGTSVQPDNVQGRFYTQMLRNFCASGRCRIWRLRFGDKVVAMDLCIEAGPTLVVLKTAFDPEYRNVSPAFLMRQEAFRQVFDEGRIKRIEFYGRLMEWHTRWTEQSRVLYHVNLYRWPLIARLRRNWRRLASSQAAAAQTMDPPASATTA